MTEPGPPRRTRRPGPVKRGMPHGAEHLAVKSSGSQLPGTSGRIAPHRAWQARAADDSRCLPRRTSVRLEQPGAYGSRRTFAGLPLGAPPDYQGKPSRASQRCPAHTRRSPRLFADLRSVTLTVVTKPAARERSSASGSRDSDYLRPRRCARVVRRGCWPRAARTAGGCAPTTTSTVVGGGSPPPSWHRRARSIRSRRSASSSSVGGAGLAAGCCSRIWHSMQTM